MREPDMEMATKRPSLMPETASICLMVLILLCLVGIVFHERPTAQRIADWKRAHPSRLEPTEYDIRMMMRDQ